MPPLTPVSFRLASDNDYRRGVILGLTLAEILLLLVFLLLLAAGALVARAQQQSERQNARLTELQSELAPVIADMNASGHRIDNVDQFADLIRRSHEADDLQRQAGALRSALAASEVHRAALQQALDSADRALAAERALPDPAEPGKTLSVAAKAADYDRMMRELAALPGGAGAHPMQDVMNRLGQYTQAMHELARLKGNGSGKPFCWVTPTGQPISMLRFELHDDGFVVLEEPERPRPDDPAWQMLEGLPRGTVIAGPDLAGLVAPLAADAARRGCRYAVDVLDRTSRTNKDGYRHLNYLLDLQFARREVDAW